MGPSCEAQDRTPCLNSQLVRNASNFGGSSQKDWGCCHFPGMMSSNATTAGLMLYSLMLRSKIPCSQRAIDIHACKRLIVKCTMYQAIPRIKLYNSIKFCSILPMALVVHLLSTVPVVPVALLPFILPVAPVAHLPTLVLAALLTLLPVSCVVRPLHVECSLACSGPMARSAAPHHACWCKRALLLPSTSS